jgi:hypothetical protein
VRVIFASKGMSKKFGCALYIRCALSIEIYGIFPKPNNFFTIFQATDCDGGWLGTMNDHIHLNVRQEYFHNPSPEKLGVP